MAPRVTASKQTMEKIADLSGHQIVINFKRLIGLKILRRKSHVPTRAIIGLGTNQGRDWAFFVLLFSLGNT